MLSAPGVGDFENHTWQPKGEHFSEECLLKLPLKIQCLFDMLKDTRKLLGYLLVSLGCTGSLTNLNLRIIINRLTFVDFARNDPCLSGVALVSPSSSRSKYCDHRATVTF